MTGISFEECFSQHFPRLVALGQSMTGDPDIARELAQEAFVRLHHQWETVGEYENPGGWLRRVMSNLLIDYHRSLTSERRAVERLANHANGDAPEPGFHGDEWSALIAGLPPRQRLIVTLHYGEDFSVAEIAEALDLSPNTVKSALSKARDAMRDRWEHHDA